jgi:hypothetical protein
MVIPLAARVLRTSSGRKSNARPSFGDVDEQSVPERVFKSNPWKACGVQSLRSINPFAGFPDPGFVSVVRQ